MANKKIHPELPSYKDRSAYMKALRQKRKTLGLKYPYEQTQRKPTIPHDDGKYYDWFSAYACDCGHKTTTNHE